MQKKYFDHDVQCIREFFCRKYGYESELYPTFNDIRRTHNLDIQLSASGFIKETKSDVAEKQDDYDAEYEEVLNGVRHQKLDSSEDDSCSDDDSNKDDSSDQETENNEEVPFNEEEDGEDEEAGNSDSDLENLHEDNKKYRPFRDKNATDKDVSIASSTMVLKKTLTESDIREKVKKQLSKTQKMNQRRKIKKGEASLARRKRRENDNVVKDSW